MYVQKFRFPCVRSPVGPFGRERFKRRRAWKDVKILLHNLGSLEVLDESHAHRRLSVIFRDISATVFFGVSIGT